MNKVAYYTGYMDKEAMAIFPGAKMYKRLLKYSPKTVRKGIRGYNRFIRGKDISSTHSALVRGLLHKGLQTTDDPAKRLAIIAKANKFTRNAQADTAHINRLMMGLGVVPPVVATGMGTAITAAGAAVPYVIPPGGKA